MVALLEENSQDSRRDGPCAGEGEGRGNIKMYQGGDAGEVQEPKDGWILVTVNHGISTRLSQCSYGDSPGERQGIGIGYDDSPRERGRKDIDPHFKPKIKL
jgi:hypothetical protein